MSARLSPVRAAVRSALLDRAPITAASIHARSRWGRVTLRGVRMYLTVLCKQGVISLCDDHYIAGPRAEAWTMERPRTRPHGTSRRYRLARAAREMV